MCTVAGSNLIKEMHSFSDKIYVNLNFGKKQSKLSGLQVALNQRLSSVIFGLTMNCVRMEMHRFYSYTKLFSDSLKMLRCIF